jgi:hypothetical protein
VGDVVQRYESPEHQDLGDAALTELEVYLKTPEGAAWAKQHNLDATALADLPKDEFLRGKKFKIGKDRTVEASVGDVIALMGDFYRTPEALRSAPDAELKELLEAINQERAGKLGGGRANAEYQRITKAYRPYGETFIELAKENKPHFTPTNRDAWKELHVKAIKMARGSGPGAGDLDTALLHDAAAGHFLTDAFASGHLFNKKDLETAIMLHLQRNPARPPNPELGAYYALVESQGVTAQLVLKNIHDRLNAEGVEVKNKKGMTWRTFGDDHLKNAEQTRHIAALAIYLSRRQVTLAANAGSPEPDTDALANEILDLLPDEESVRRVTQTAIGYIPQAVGDITGLMYRQRRVAEVGLQHLVGPLAPVLRSNLETLTDPGRRKQLEQLQELQQRTGLPQIAPSFTLGTF